MKIENHLHSLYIKDLRGVKKTPLFKYRVMDLACVQCHL